MREIPLTKGLFALVDDEDFDRVSQHKWYASLEGRGTKYYAIRWKRSEGKRLKIRMHHFILGITSKDLPGQHVVDHINHNSLDNRKFNLEIVTQTENMRRSAGWKRKLPDLDF